MANLHIKPVQALDAPELALYLTLRRVEEHERAGVLVAANSKVIKRLQAQGIKIGCSTGFTRPMVDVLEKAAKKQGYVPDASVAGDEVLHGARPRPFMVYRNLDLLDAWPIESVIKIDDTTSGVGEGLNAG